MKLKTLEDIERIVGQVAASFVRHEIGKPATTEENEADLENLVALGGMVLIDLHRIADALENMAMTQLAIARQQGAVKTP